MTMPNLMNCPHSPDGWCLECLKSESQTLTEHRIKELEEELAELQASFDLRWKADMRAIKRWHKDNPGNELTWPDHTDLCCWLMDQLEKETEACAEAVQNLDISLCLDPMIVRTKAVGAIKDRING